MNVCKFQDFRILKLSVWFIISTFFCLSKQLFVVLQDQQKTEWNYKKSSRLVSKVIKKDNLLTESCLEALSSAHLHTLRETLQKLRNEVSKLREENEKLHQDQIPAGFSSTEVSPKKIIKERGTKMLFLLRTLLPQLARRCVFTE